MRMGLDTGNEKLAFEGVMPWLPPTQPLTVEALGKLDRPLAAWMLDPELHLFDAQDYYAQFADEPGGLSRLEKSIAQLAPRPEWRIERIWLPDEETAPEEEAAYEAGAVTIAGHILHPRCLDAYATIAYDLAGLADGEDEDTEDSDVPGDLEEALSWARAGVCVLQQSLPFPFRDVLTYGELDNRPAHRLLYAYADLLRRKHPRKAAPWFTALVYLNPADNLGARFVAPSGPR